MRPRYSTGAGATLAATLLLASGPFAQGPTLLRDVNAIVSTTSEGSDVPGGEAIQLGNELVFVASTRLEGPELFKTDGTTAGTSIVLDSVPGAQDGPAPASLARLGTRVLYAAFDFDHGVELWSTDGTPGGTGLLVDIRAGTESSTPRALLTFGNRVLFTANDGVHGRELWITDGTAAGTRLLLDANPGAGSAVAFAQDRLVEFAGRVWFAATNGLREELWWSDGTAAGTSPLPFPGTLWSPRELTVVGSTMYFFSPGGGPALYRTDGTAAGTTLVTRVPTGSTGPHSLTPFGSGCVFVNSEPTYGAEPWITDGTAAGTRLLADVWPGSISSAPLMIGASGNAFFFAAAHPSYGRELFRSDGTAAGTRLVMDIWPGANRDGVPPTTEFVFLGSRLIFTAIDPVFGLEPWITDGSTSGTGLLADVCQTPYVGSTPRRFARLPDGRLMFFADDRVNGHEPWVTDGSRSGTTLLADLTPATTLDSRFSGSSLGEVDSLLGFALFTAQDRTHGIEPWITDGTTSGTRLLADIRPGPDGSQAGGYAVAGSRVYFTAGDGVHGYELWSTDGTTAGTRLELDIIPGPDSGGLSRLTPMPWGKLLWSAWDPVYGSEPYVYDVQSRNLRRLLDLRPGSSSSTPDSFVQSGDRAFFSANDGVHGRELWLVDQNLTRIRMVVDLAPGFDDGVRLHALRDRSMLEIGGQLLFAGDDGNHEGLWVTDGTGPGTRLVPGFPPGRTAYVREMTRRGDDVWFLGRATGAFGVWHTTVDAVNATPLDFFASQFGARDPRLLAVASGRLLVLALDSADVGALWGSDGTAQGTVRLTPPEVVVDHRTPVLRSVGSRRAFFTATTTRWGRELWVTDGTAAGTRMLADIAPGGASSDPEALFVFDGKLLFDADDLEHGREPFVFDLGAVSSPIGLPSGWRVDSLPWIETDDPVLGRAMQVYGYAPAASAAALLLGPPSGEMLQPGGNRYVEAPAVWSIQSVVGGRWSDAIPVPSDPSLAGLPVALQALVAPGWPGTFPASQGVRLTLGF